MDKGIHIGSWGQLQGISTRSPHVGATNLALSPNCKEWKVDMDSPTDTHRHLSHLIGLYPGYAITSYDPAVQNGSMYGYSKSDVLAAAEVSLFHRGNGTGPDADAGWEKVWRAACWAQLANASEFYFELTVRPCLICLLVPNLPLKRPRARRICSTRSSGISRRTCSISIHPILDQTAFSK